MLLAEQHFWSVHSLNDNSVCWHPLPDTLVFDYKFVLVQVPQTLEYCNIKPLHFFFFCNDSLFISYWKWILKYKDTQKSDTVVVM